jgi:acetyl esterase/lipase
VPVLAREDHDRPGPGIYHVHGGGMVMGDRFASVGRSPTGP